VLSLLALKLTSTRRVTRVYDIAADPGAALFAGLTALPKATIIKPSAVAVTASSCAKTPSPPHTSSPFPSACREQPLYARVPTA
jgi:hypothetical protein